jgi:TrmH family RNA methyltransferase
VSALTSRDNPKVRRWAKLAADARYRRSEKRALIEGPHLLAAALQHGVRPLAVLATEKGLADAEIGRLVSESGLRPVLLGDAVFRFIVGTEAPQGLAAEVAIPSARAEAGSTVFLEGVQDPSNIGAIIRSAAAFGVMGVVLDRACADPWSPKALRAGMGGHFAVAIQARADLGAALNAFKGALVCTVPEGGVPLRAAKLAGPLGWIFGGEGEGLSDETLRKVPLRVSIPMAGGTESLNVAAAAAICLCEAFCRSGASAAPSRSAARS